ncbi:MAG: response regulator [Planctomycetota bacterium]
MRLDQLTPEHVRAAIAIYLEHAWPASAGRKPPITLTDIEGPSTLRELRELFEHPRKAEGVAHRRYTLRLGNHRYPFMKFVVQEYLVDGEFFFSADTHDEMRVDPTMPDYAEWQELRAFNRQLKLDIERAWSREGLPTHDDLRALCEGLARLEQTDHAAGARGRLLVVDDEEAVAAGLAAVLRAHGYAVETAFDGRQVLERMACDPLPDLVVLDFAMPELDGEEVMRRLRADPRTAAVPLLLATASDIDLTSLQRASGLLRKPYPREMLVGMIDRLLRAK